MAFRVLIIGGTGQVGDAVVRALAAEPSCAEIVMVNRRAASPNANSRVRQVILDTADAQFLAEVTKIARSMVAQGDPVYGASCVGVGKGSIKRSEEELKALEIGIVGGFFPRLSWRRHHTIFSTLGSGKRREKQDPCPEGRLPTPRDFSSGNYRRQCSHPERCSLVRASYSGILWHDRAERYRARLCH